MQSLWSLKSCALLLVSYSQNVLVLSFLFAITQTLKNRNYLFIYLVCAVCVFLLSVALISQTVLTPSHSLVCPFLWVSVCLGVRERAYISNPVIVIVCWQCVVLWLLSSLITRALHIMCVSVFVHTKTCYWGTVKDRIIAWKKGKVISSWRSPVRIYREKKNNKRINVFKSIRVKMSSKSRTESNTIDI